MFVNFLKNNNSLKQLLFSQNSNMTENSLFSYSSSQIQSLLADVFLGDTFTSSVDVDDLSFKNGEFSSFSNSGNQVNITDIMNDFIQSQEVINIVDSDGNGVFSTEEMNGFMGIVEGLDENPDNLSMDDIFSAMQSIENGTFPDQQIEADDELQEMSGLNANRTNRSGSRNGSDRDTGDLGGTDKPKGIESLSLEELQGKKSDKEAELKTAQEKVNAAYSGETEAIKSAQDDCDARKQEYEDALKNDEAITDELKNRQQTNQKDIDNQKGVINQLKFDIHSKENEITSQKSTISSDKSTIGALESSISELKAQKSEDPEVQSDIQSKLRAAEERLSAAKDKLAKDQETLEKLEGEKVDLETDLSSEEETLSGYETERFNIESEIQSNCGEPVKVAMEAFKLAEANVEKVKADELKAAKESESKLQTELDKINSTIDTKSAKQIEREFSVFNIGNPEQLFKAMGLEEKGLNFEVFSRALEGYESLGKKGNGLLGIFDTTQGDNAERYYLLDLNNFELLGQSQMKTGSGNMGNVQMANKPNSHATLSGFEMAGSEYYSNSMGKKALRLIGLEDGINDNAMKKGTVVHYTTNNHTWGCKGFPPVKTNGRINKEATYDKMRELFPENTIVYTYPTDNNYWNLSELYA